MFVRNLSNLQRCLFEISTTTVLLGFCNYIYLYRNLVLHHNFRCFKCFLLFLLTFCLLSRFSSPSDYTHKLASPQSSYFKEHRQLLWNDILHNVITFRIENPKTTVVLILKISNKHRCKLDKILRVFFRP